MKKGKSRKKKEEKRRGRENRDVKQWYLDKPDIVNHLVFGLNAYTLRELKSFKSLEAYEQFCSGWVQDLLIHKPANCESTVILAEVRPTAVITDPVPGALPSCRFHLQPKSNTPLLIYFKYFLKQVMASQCLSKIPLKVWVIITSTGEVCSAHCTCMAGVAETCTHVEALLFKVQATIRCREMRPGTDEPADWILQSNMNKVHAEVGYKIDYTSGAMQKSLNCLLDTETGNMPGLRTCARKITTPLPTQSDLTRFYGDLHKAGDKSVILSVLPQPSVWERRKNELEAISLQDHDYCAGPAPAITSASTPGVGMS